MNRHTEIQGTVNRKEAEVCEMWRRYKAKNHVVHFKSVYQTEAFARRFGLLEKRVMKEVLDLPLPMIAYNDSKLLACT